MSKEIFRGRFRVAGRTNFGSNIQLSFYLKWQSYGNHSFMHPLKHLTMATLRAKEPDQTNEETNPVIN